MPVHAPLPVVTMAPWVTTAPPVPNSKLQFPEAGMMLAGEVDQEKPRPMSALVVEEAVLNAKMVPEEPPMRMALPS